MITVFVHGAGRGGAAAWPLQQQLPAACGERVWLDWLDELAGTAHPAMPNPVEAQAATVLRALTQPGNVAAHSHGAVAALLAAGQCPARVRRLVLFEPACFSLVRGERHVEEHIAALAPVLALATDPAITDDAYATSFFSALGGPAPAVATDAQRLALRRLRRLPAPWTIPLSPVTVARFRPLVITGGWSPLYEELAGRLVQLGARHEVLAGHGHRPQDHPRANDLLCELSTTP